MASSLQKSIRRGLKEEAVFWAFELDSRYPDYLWKRLTIISNEDIGLADPPVLILVDTLRRQYELLRGGGDRRMVLTNAVVALCMAKKTRLGDDMTTTIHRRRVCENWRLEVPDFALDRHTRRGQVMGRGWDHWTDEGCKLENEVPGLNPYKAEATQLRKQYGKLKSPAPKKHDSRQQVGDLFEEEE